MLNCLILCALRMAPEHPFPAAVEDCYAAVKWIHANAKVLGAASGRLAVGGDSAGLFNRLFMVPWALLCHSLLCS